MGAFLPAPILLPKAGVDPAKWAVIACDQFTSEPEYWEKLNRTVGAAPSTLRMILPEAYLGRNEEIMLKGIQQAMKDYLVSGILQKAGNCMILVDRQTPYVNRRLGLVLAIDLEQYSYAAGTRPLIRATEQTVPSRIPPRVKIRESAPIELPHVLLLMNDKEQRIIETLYEHRDQLEKVYQFDLNMDGGRLTGYQIRDTAKILAQFDQLIEPGYSTRMYGNPDAQLLGLVGDGNHSLAAAKTHWENVKKTLPEERRFDHPARFALVELENIYDRGLKFEPIHRVVFGAGADFLPGLKRLQTGTYPAAIYGKTVGLLPFTLPKVAPAAIKLVQDYIDEYLKVHPTAKVDFVHGWDHLVSVCDKEPGAYGITLPPLAKEDLFPYVLKAGVLPRKSFSMGEAVEKRYYFESKFITD